MRRSWTKEEDETILRLHAQGIQWSDIAAQLPGRVKRQIRYRYINVLDPTLKRSYWTNAEDEMLINKQRVLGNDWLEVAKFIPGRSALSVKNHWHCKIRK